MNTSTILGLAAGVALSANTLAATFTESGDAGDLINTGAQNTGSGALTLINGSTGGPDFVDAYRIRVSDASAFFATTSTDDDATASADFDTRLWLFDTSGNLVMANDDTPNFSNLQSFMTNPAGFAGALVDSPGSVTSGTEYFLVIGAFSNNLIDAFGEEVADIDFTNGFDSLYGQNPLFDPGTASWDDADSFGEGAYSIALGGVEAVPSPGAAALLGVAGLAAMRRRR